ncbi:MAG: hypothetical protein RL199_2325, partial [Pseudomonadota bacterium]
MSSRPKWLYALPNLFTLGSIFCGVWAILQTTSHASGDIAATDDYFSASLAIILGSFLDACDGRVARLTGTQSAFGVQLDSLADVITFGVAPSILLYRWALAPLGLGGFVVACVFASCGALRLARFNVSAARETGPSNYFTGLPIPLAAGAVVSVVIAATRAPEPRVLPPMAAALMTLVLSYLMVSTVKYHSFKKAKADAKSLGLVAAVLAIGASIAVLAGPNLVLVSYAVVYIAL